MNLDGGTGCIPSVELTQADDLAQNERMKRSDELEQVEVLEQPDKHLVITDLETQPLPESEEAPTIGAIVAGHICLEIIPALVGSNITFAPGKLIEAGKAVLATGGPVSNTGLALHNLGVTTRLMGKVGNDLFGQAIFQIIASHGSDLASDMIIAPGEVSSYSVILSPSGADRIVIHAPGSDSAFSAADIRYELVEHAQLFHFGYPQLIAHMYSAEGTELADIFKRVKELGVTTSLDLSLPDPSSSSGRIDWPTLLTTVLPYVDVFMPGVEALLAMLRRPLFDKLTSRARRGNVLDYVEPEVFSELGKTLLDMGTKIVGIKAGRRGLYLRTSAHHALEEMGHAQPAHLLSWAKRELWAPCFSTEVASTSDAGDATIAGFLMGLLRGMTAEAALSAACAVGACSVEGNDALSGIRSWPKIMARIIDGWPRLMLQDKKLPALDLAAAGWRWDEVQEVWIGPGDPHHA